MHLKQKQWFSEMEVFLPKMKNSIMAVKLEVVKRKNVYLGFMLTTAMSSTQSSKQFALKGKRADFNMVRAISCVLSLKSLQKTFSFNFLIHKFNLSYCMRPKSEAYWSRTMILKKCIYMLVNDF